MLEYPLDEAEALLSKNLTAATTNVEQINTDLDFLRDQITTTEVSMARVHNWKVKKGPSSATAAAAAAAAKK